MKHQDDPNYIQSLGRALEILHLFQDDTPLSLSSVAERTGMSTSAAFRMLHTLCKHDILAQAGSKKLYFLNDEAILLGLAGIRGRKIYKAAQPLISNYYTQTGNTIGIMSLVGLSAVAVANYSAMPDELGLVRPYEQVPLHRGASQRILLAYLPPERCREYMDSLFLTASTQKALLDQLEKIREQGWDYTEEQLTLGVWALSVPLFYTSGAIAGDLYSGGYVCDLTPELRGERLSQLQRMAGQIQHQLSLLD